MRMKGKVVNATIIRLSECQRTCKNCVYLGEDFCTYPNGWHLDNKNRCAQFKRKKGKAEER